MLKMEYLNSRLFPDALLSKQVSGRWQNHSVYSVNVRGSFKKLSTDGGDRLTPGSRHAPGYPRPNPTVAPCEVKLQFWFFAAGCRFVLHNVAICLQTASRYESRERFRNTSMHLKEGYGLIQIFTEKIRISPTKLWRVWFCQVCS